MRKYRLVAKKGEGTFSEVLKAQNVKDGKYHAIKCMKNHFDSIDQVNNLREIQALRRLSPHQHIITLEEVLYDQPTGRLALVFELMDANLYELIRGRRHYLNANLIRSYMFQLVRALHHMHRKGIFHRDIKPENILIENTSEMGRGLKLADFGSCRGIYSKQPYTEYISTRWYRAPECLLTDGCYGAEMDLWGAGCVFFEITSLYPLFPGTNELDQISRIHKVLGTPSADLLAKFKRNGAAHVNFDFPEQKGIGLGQLIPHASSECVDLMQKQLAYDAADRISAREGLQHAYFKDVRELEARRQQHAGQARADADAASASSGQAPAQGGKGQKGLPQLGGGGGVVTGVATGGQAEAVSHKAQQQPTQAPKKKITHTQSTSKHSTSSAMKGFIGSSTSINSTLTGGADADKSGVPLPPIEGNATNATTKGPTNYASTYGVPSGKGGKVAGAHKKKDKKPKNRGNGYDSKSSFGGQQSYGGGGSVAGSYDKAVTHSGVSGRNQGSSSHFSLNHKSFQSGMNAQRRKGR